MEERMVTVSVEMPASAVDQSRYFFQLIGEFPRDAKAYGTQLKTILGSEEATPKDGETLAQVAEFLEQRREMIAQLIICLHSIFRHAVISDPEGKEERVLQ